VQNERLLVGTVASIGITDIITMVQEDTHMT